MPQFVELPVRSSSTFRLFPLSVSNDGSDYLVGRRGGSYLAVSSVGLEAITLLSEGMPAGRVKELLATKHALDAVSLEPLLHQLLSAKLLQSVDGQRIDDAPVVPRSGRPASTTSRVAWLFSRPALCVYVTVFALGFFAVLSDRRVLPHPSVLLGGGRGTALLSLALIALIAAKHEFAHLAAGRFLGAAARCRLGYRLFFPVVETDLSDLWLVPHRRRYLAYAAGVLSDLLLGCLGVSTLWAHLRGWISLPPTLHHAVELTVLIVGCVTVWQLNVFLRTDGYYILSNALGCRNLAGDAKDYLWRWLRKTRGGVSDAGTASRPGFVRVYAIGYVLNVIVLGGLGCLGLVAIVRSGTSATSRELVALLVTITLLGCAIAAHRQRTRVRYRLKCSAEL